MQTQLSRFFTRLRPQEGYQTVKDAIELNEDPAGECMESGSELGTGSDGDLEDGRLLPIGMIINTSSNIVSQSERDPVIALIIVLGVGWAIGLYITYPFPTTIPIFVGGAICLAGWTIYAWARVAVALLRERGTGHMLSVRSARQWIALIFCTILVILLLSLGFRPPQEETPILYQSALGVQEKYFIAAILYNNEAIFVNWSAELVRLAQHRTFTFRLREFGR